LNPKHSPDILLTTKSKGEKMAGDLHMQAVIPNATIRQVYEAWMDSRIHGEFTGGPAEIEPEVGGKFTIFDGYITGETLELTPFTRIVQAWRTTEFPDGAPDSRLEVLLESLPDGCRLTIDQTNLPEDQVDSYKSGWMEYYFDPMTRYFSR
jgi:activator of HSP90 ATPase